MAIPGGNGEDFADIERAPREKIEYCDPKLRNQPIPVGRDNRRTEIAVQIDPFRNAQKSAGRV